MSATTHAPKRLDPAASPVCRNAGTGHKPRAATPARRRPDRALTVPFVRQGTGREVTYAELFLTSNESSYAKAYALCVDAGCRAGVVPS